MQLKESVSKSSFKLFNSNNIILFSKLKSVCELKMHIASLINPNLLNNKISLKDLRILKYNCGDLLNHINISDIIHIVQQEIIKKENNIPSDLILINLESKL